MIKVLQYVLYDLVRMRFTWVYTLLLFGATTAIVQMEADPDKVVISLINILLMVVPLFSVVFTTIHYYNSYEFISLMVTQPVTRRAVFLAEYIAVAAALTGAFLFGVALPLLAFTGFTNGYTVIFVGVLLTLVFVSLAFLASVWSSDKARAIGYALLFWFYFVLLYDGLFLWLLFTFSDYPLERPVLFLVSLNPVDLARILILLRLDMSALMGYTGAFFREFFGNGWGLTYSGTVLLIWVIIPLLMALRMFIRKDL